MKKLFLSCLTLLATSLPAEVKLPGIFSDGMVLQQKQLVRVWGNAEVGEEVKVVFGEQTHSIVTDGTGQWSVTLNPMNANAQPADLVVTGKNTLTFKNVLVG
ncbi:MAG TPA: 9-O-acetylesterase, partial [Prosthecobacter sp.]